MTSPKQADPFGLTVFDPAEEMLSKQICATCWPSSSLVAICALFLLCSLDALPQNTAGSNRPLSPQIAQLRKSVESGDKHAEKQFWSAVEQTGAPLVERLAADPKHVLVTFLWHGNSSVQNVLLVSGLTNGSYSRIVLQDNVLTCIAGTNVWFRTYRVRSDARFTYQFSIDDSLVPSEEERNPATREDVGRTL